ncbi:hypothetical protein [Oryzibacter oryziterrae]|uniref:hypothetical protein n=1 Tax=Oryzibacter oryziterrae TaxID=2766474 RepID=UPI001F1F4FE5|nr:hypothetical protein [Oryzibacter oryziterrae]
MRRLLVPVLALLAVAFGVAAGPDAWGKLALLAGQPALAARLLSDPAARGVALYHAGDYTSADSAFTAAGRVATYDRALTLAKIGKYDLSLAYFDAVLFANPRDDDARINRDIVAKFVNVVVGETNGAHGGIPTKVMGVASGDQNDPVVPGTLTDQRHVYKPLKARGIEASVGWMTGLTDSPGEYLKKLLAVEYKRRQDNGLIQPEESPW